MFALVKLIKESLYSIRFGDDEVDEFENNEYEDDKTKKDEFRRLFNNWSDVEYLDAFFTAHQADLFKPFYHPISIEEAIERTLDEAFELEQKILKIAVNGKDNKLECLQTLFKPLNNKDAEIYPIPGWQLSKAYGTYSKSWLRIYAIRIDENLFVVTGGAIKLTETMNDRPHLIKELEKLELVQLQLKESGIIDNDSLIEYFEL